MNRKVISTKTAYGISVLMLAFLAASANAQTTSVNAAPESDKSALVDEAPAPAAPKPAPVQAKPAEKAAPQQKAESKETAATKKASEPAPCEPAPATDSGSKIPVFPIVLSSIATIAFVVLAIIF